MAADDERPPLRAGRQYDVYTQEPPNWLTAVGCSASSVGSLSFTFSALTFRSLRADLSTVAHYRSLAGTAALPDLKPASAHRLRGAAPHLLCSIGKPILQIPIHVAPAQIPSSESSASTEGWRMLWSAIVSGSFHPKADPGLRETVNMSAIMPAEVRAWPFAVAVCAAA
jgi:hypothetical protein